jgi:N-acyl-D-aspartate/D-glutamate deacylase
MDLCYDLLLQREGTAVLIWFSTGYLDGDLRKKGECLADPQYIMGIGDAGAHVQFICDASFTTFLLAHWGKNRTKGPRFPIEYLVKKITKDAAELYGMNDRGAIEVGRRADLNVIDFDRLALEHPRMAADLPSGCKRFLQGAVGYDMTIVKGVVVRRNDQDTGARPGRLVRNRGAVPAALPSHTN